MIKTTEIITDMTKLGDAIKAAGKAHVKVDGTWQTLALSAIQAFAAHGNVFYINRVYLSLGKGARHAAMISYFLAFGGVQANLGENKAETPFLKDPAKHADMTGATETMWFNMEKEPKPDQVLDYLALAMKVIKRSAKEGQEVTHGPLRMRLAEVIGQYADEHDIEGLKLPTIGAAEDATDEALEGIAA